MAGTAKNFSVTTISAGMPGTLWANVAIPAGGGRITLDTDGTPDATANPSAVNLGMTKEGATFTFKPTTENFNADEFYAPIKTIVTAVEGIIEAELLQVLDFTALAQCTQGFGTKTTGSGYEQFTFGRIPMTYVPVAWVFPTEADPTKYAVVQLYRAFNEAGMESIQIAKAAQGSCKVMFRGLDIVSRTAADTLGSYWKQVAA